MFASIYFYQKDKNLIYDPFSLFLDHKKGTKNSSKIPLVPSSYKQKTTKFQFKIHVYFDIKQFIQLFFKCKQTINMKYDVNIHFFLQQGHSKYQNNLKIWPRLLNFP